MRISFKQIKNWLEKNDKVLGPIAMAIGFVIDNLTLQRIDLWIENLVIITYLTVAVLCILVLDVIKARVFEHKLVQRLKAWLPFVLQMVFGGLFSAFIVFYTRSASWFVSWPFLLILFGLLIGNEFFRERYSRLTFHLTVLYIAIFAYSVFAVPVLAKRIGLEIFLLSGGVSILLIMSVIFILHIFGPKAIKKSKDRLVLSIMVVYLAFNFLYFTNIIPPIPLALTDAGVYHTVVRRGNDYIVEYEPAPWYIFWRQEDPVYHWQSGERVYVYSSIFAPTKFTEQIHHRWLEKQDGRYVERDRLGYAISGGRDGGYRGYSYKSAVNPGQWRVDVVTEQGQTLGRIYFEIITGTPESLVTDQK